MPIERTVEQLMDCVILLGPNEWEWRDVKASVIIRDVLRVFSQRIGQDVQLVDIWEDTLFDYVGLHHPYRIREVLDQVAAYTGSRMVCQDTRVSFVRKDDRWMNVS